MKRCLKFLCQVPWALNTIIRVGNLYSFLQNSLLNLQNWKVTKCSCFFLDRYLKDVVGFKIPGVSSKKLLNSGFKFRYGLDEMFDGAIQCCKEKGILKFNLGQITLGNWVGIELEQW